MATATAKNTYRAGPRTPHSVRLAESTKGTLKQVVQAGTYRDAQQWGEQVIEAALGFARCRRGSCPDRTPPVPVTFGDLTGMTFGEAAALAVEAAESQHPRHEPVFIGAEGRATAPVAAKAVRFVEPKQASA